MINIFLYFNLLKVKMYASVIVELIKLCLKVKKERNFMECYK